MPTKRAFFRRIALMIGGALAAATAVAVIPAGAAPLRWDLVPEGRSPLGTAPSAGPGKSVMLRPNRAVTVEGFAIKASIRTSNATLRVQVRTDGLGEPIASGERPPATTALTAHDVALAAPVTLSAGVNYEVRFDLVTGTRVGWGLNDNIEYYAFDNWTFDPALGFTVGPFLVLDGASNVGTTSANLWRSPYLPHVEALTPAEDTTAPTVTLDPGERPQWFTRADTSAAGLAVLAAATDAESGVARIDCAVDATPGRYETDRVTLTIGDGVHPVECTATDHKENTSAPVRGLYHVDTTPPDVEGVTMGQHPQAGSARAGAPGAPVRVVVSDATSGVDQVTCSVGDEVFTGHGEVLEFRMRGHVTELECVATDVAGNVSPVERWK